MITQNPIIGRSRKKIGNVYARTLYGMNIIQSCPKPSTKPMSPKRLACQTAFRFVSKMANQLPQKLLNDLFYAAPIGKSRRNALTSQLMQAIVRDGTEISYNPNLIAALGGNPIALRTPVEHVVSERTFTISVDDLQVTPVAQISMLPCVIALSYDLRVAYNLLPLTAIENNIITIGPVPSSWLGNSFFLFPLFPVNVGSKANPIFTFGRFDKTQSP